MRPTILYRIPSLLGVLLFCSACIGQRSAVTKEQGLLEVGYSEQAGEGDFSVTLHIRRDSTFYQFYNIGKRRSWSGKTEPRFWAQLERTVNGASLAQAQRATRKQGYDGHSASIFVQQKDSSHQFLFDLLQNSREVTAGTLFTVLNREQQRLYSLSAKTETSNP